MSISTTLLESTEEVVDAKTSVEESPLAAQGTSLLAQCRSSSHMSCCDIGVPRDCNQRYMLRDVRWFELCVGKGDLHFPDWPRGSLDWFRDYGDSRDDECHLKFPFQSKRTGERPFPHAKRHERKSARAKRSSPRYPLRGSALGKGKWCTCSWSRCLCHFFWYLLIFLTERVCLRLYRHRGARVGTRCQGDVR